GEKIPEQPQNVYSWPSWISEDAFYHELLIHTDEGVSINSDFLNGLKTSKAKEKMIEWLEKNKLGKKAVNYKLRDWLISRQRYWGAPIPIIYCEKCGEVPVSEKDLPVKLPTDVDFKPTGESPLVNSKKFHDVKCPKCGAKARRESDTMDTFVCSSWYYLRYADPKNDKEFASKEALKKWLPVDVYVGGAEHSVLHLLYSRFFTKALQKFGYLNFSEPFLKLRHQGTILAPDGHKMSKSKGNVINPDDIIKDCQINAPYKGYGADTLRMYEMFLGPLEDTKPWNTESIAGIKRFLNDVHEFYFTWIKGDKKLFEGWINENKATSENVNVPLNKTIKKVGEDIENFKFNTAISQLMILKNNFFESPESLERKPGCFITYIFKKDFETFLKLLAPFAPFITEKIWKDMGHKKSIFKQSWPKYDEKLIKEEKITLIVQVNGKMRDKLEVEKNLSQKEVEALTLGREKIKKYVARTKIKKVIFVPNKLINLVT
ncbi:MAG: class I tRNA ligase family protein, partial [Candidatus Pacebacteria bacterium]|nr:class I tRNA ligase family protein [Candidatus Paceibacterota bacterium]